MSIISRPKKILALKVVETVGINPYGNAGAGAGVTGDNAHDWMPNDDNFYSILSTTSAQQYSASENAWIALPSPALGGTFGAGTCTESMAYGAPNGVVVQTATGGNTKQINTGITLSANLVGYKVKIVEGPNAGTTHTIAYNTIGANASIVLTAPASVNFTSASKFILVTGSYWVFNAGTLSSSSFRVYDNATNAWTSRSITGLPATWGTEGQLLRQHSIDDNYASGSVVSATSTTLVVNGLTGTGYNWTNYEVEIVSGTGAGQFRVITAGATSTLTVATAWTTIPDATSTYVIKGDRNALYLLGGGAVTMYKFNIAANTWATIAPGTGRGGVFAAGGTADIIKDNPDWTIPLVAAGKLGGQNGRYIYSFRGNGTSNLDIYDIAANTWLAYGYGNAGGEGMSTVSCSIADGKYIYVQNGSSGRIHRFDTTAHALLPWVHNVYPQSTGTNGDKMWVVKFKDGADTITWIYTLVHSGNIVQRICVL